MRLQLHMRALLLIGSSAAAVACSGDKTTMTSTPATSTYGQHVSLDATESWTVPAGPGGAGNCVMDLGVFGPLTISLFESAGELLGGSVKFDVTQTYKSSSNYTLCPTYWINGHGWEFT